MYAALLSSSVAVVSWYCGTSPANRISLASLSVCVQQLVACPLPGETEKEKGGVTEERREGGRGGVNMVDDRQHNSWYNNSIV